MFTATATLIRAIFLFCVLAGDVILGVVVGGGGVHLLSLPVQQRYCALPCARL
jgi:hypothetical protein